MEEAVPVAHTKFRLQGRAIFLTWPQNAATKEDTLAACVQQWPSATFIVVAEEEHKTEIRIYTRLFSLRSEWT